MSHTELKTAFEDVVNRFMARFKDGDMKALAENEYAPDCILMAPGKDVKRGREGALEFVTAFKDAGIEDMVVRVTDVGYSKGEGELMFGCCNFDCLASDGSKKDECKAINICKKIKGTWYLYAVCFNSNIK
ncbi:uncharacterized protein LOC144447569 [Glandiceps talaboti]